MTKAKEAVTFLGFSSDAEVETEHTEARMVYRYKDGTLEINYHNFKRRAYQCGDRVIAFGSQRMPCRKSAHEAMLAMVEAAKEPCSYCSTNPVNPTHTPFCGTMCAIQSEGENVD